MTQCEKCDGQVADQLARRIDRDRSERIYHRMRASGLPIDYRTNKRLVTDCPNPQVVALCHTLGSNDCRGLYLHGDAGSFKTTLAAGWLAKEIREDKSGLYVSMFDLMSDIHNSYRYGDEESRVMSRAVLVDKCVDARRFVLDDLGKEKASEHAAGVIFEILDGRYRNWKRGNWMIVTSNFDLDSLCDRFEVPELAEPIRRRLAEMTVAVEMTA